MNPVIYLSNKSATKSALIFIKVNTHNLNGWMEKPNGKAYKPVNKSEVAHEK